jgi:hypothetical protein
MTKVMVKRAVLLLVGMLVVGVPAGRDAGAEDSTKTLTGTFVWTHKDGKGDLEAIFTPTGEATWNVDFHFDFRGPHTYSGTAKGSLSEGPLSGTVQNESKERTWTFTGSFEGGTFKGTHAEIVDGKEQATGTLTLGA